jgi:nitrite reductase/ring-hydroxylating ferredoxin subunit
VVIPVNHSGQAPVVLGMSDTHSMLSRRAALQGTGVAVAAGTALGACGDSGTTGSSATKPATTAATSGPEPSPAEAELGPSSEVPVGGGKIYPDAKVVVTQPAAGTFKAFDTTCPHRSCPVTAVSKDGIMCRCHGSTFALADGTPSPTSPAKQPLESKKVTVADGKLSVT